MVTGVPGGRARSALATARARGSPTCAGSPRPARPTPTRIELARAGRARGHRAGGRPPDRRAGAGRAHAGRRRPGASLLVSVLLRPPAAGRWTSRTMAVGVSPRPRPSTRWPAFAPRLKWPNDLVWPGDGSAPTASWPASSPRPTGRRRRSRRLDAGPTSGRRRGRHRPQRGVAGRRCPTELADIAVALNHVVGRAGRPRGPADRAARRLGPRYDALVRRRPRRRCSTSGGARSATLGRRVRVELGADDVEGTAVDVTDDGHLVVETHDGDAPRRSRSATSSTSAAPDRRPRRARRTVAQGSRSRATSVGERGRERAGRGRRARRAARPSTRGDRLHVAGGRREERLVGVARARRAAASASIDVGDARARSARVMPARQPDDSGGVTQPAVDARRRRWSRCPRRGCPAVLAKIASPAPRSCAYGEGDARSRRTRSS